MSIIGNNSDALLHGLSDFWLQYFRDVGDLRALYEGTEVLLGQAYLNLLSDALNAAVVETPLFRKEYYKLITIRSTDLVNGVYTSGTTFGRIPVLQNKIIAPTDTLEEGIDYTVGGQTITFTRTLFVDGLPALEGFATREGDAGVWEIALWAVDAQVDEFDLYHRFGHFFSDPRWSSEAYRMFIRGMMQMYLHGPAVRRLESALNIIAGLPVVREDGEVVVSATAGSVVTSLNTYTFPTAVPLRPDLVAGLTLSAFESLTTAVRVGDAVRDPEWWKGITVPEALLPGAPPEVRRATSRLAENLVWSVGAPSAERAGYARVGDPDFVLGVLGPPTSPIPRWRHRAAYILLDRVLKHNTFAVVVDPTIAIPGLSDLLASAKPAHTKLFVNPAVTSEGPAGVTPPFPPVVTSPGTRVSPGSYPVSGTGLPGATIDVFRDGVPTLSATAGADGAWATTATVTLTVADSPVSFTATQTYHGARSAQSAVVRIVITDGPTIGAYDPAPPYANGPVISPNTNGYYILQFVRDNTGAVICPYYVHDASFNFAPAETGANAQRIDFVRPDGSLISVDWYWVGGGYVQMGPLLNFTLPVGESGPFLLRVTRADNTTYTYPEQVLLRYAG